MDITRAEATRLPRIGVASQWQRDTDFLKFPVAYVAALEAAGGEAVVLSTFRLPPGEPPASNAEIIDRLDPMDASPLDGLSGLIIPGGGDIDPEWYGSERHPRTHSINHRRDRFEQTLLRAALERDMPLLAICHGMQMLNITLGGTLDQHLGDKPHLLEHNRDIPRAEPVHKLRIKERSPLAAILQDSVVDVNSHHHQGIARLGEGLNELAWAEDGVLEAIAVDDSTWAMGVQWHPEAMALVDGRQMALFESFVEACSSYEIASMRRVQPA